MSNPDSKPNETPPRTTKPRRRWFRFLYQFSLRTMLIGMTLAAVACWWFLQPPVQEEEFAGRYLKLRRQVRATRLGDGSTTTDAGGWVPVSETTFTSVGTWQLRDDYEDLLADGRYLNDLPHGKWTLWYPSGRKAAEGEAFRGAKSGLWRVWDEHGTLRSEVTYRAAAPKQLYRQPRPAMAPWTGFGSMGPMMIGGPIGQMPPMRPLVSPPGGFMPILPLPENHVAERHGPCRVWYASGKLQYEGHYADDRRDGTWKLYDEQGNVTEKGEYKADLRDGEWTILASGVRKLPDDIASRVTPDHPPADASRSPSKVVYVAGRTQAEHNALLDRLRADLASGIVRRQVAAAARLEELGQHALPILHEQLQSGSTEAKILALRILTEHEALSREMVPQIAPLIGDDDPRLATRAMLAIYLLAPERRGQLHRRLIELALASSNRDLKLAVLAHMCDANPNQRQATFMKLVEILAEDTANEPGIVNYYLSPDWDRLTRLKSDPVPLLAQSFVHSDARVRLYILLVLEQIVEFGAGTLSNQDEYTWPIPPTVQAVIDRAKTDPDPGIRQQAEAIGREPQFRGGGGLF
jgi:hypothetical protein